MLANFQVKDSTFTPRQSNYVKNFAGESTPKFGVRTAVVRKKSLA